MQNRFQRNIFTKCNHEEALTTYKFLLILFSDPFVLYLKRTFLIVESRSSLIRIYRFFFKFFI